MHLCGYTCIYAYTHARGKHREHGRCRTQPAEKVIRSIMFQSGKDCQNSGLGTDGHSSCKTDYLGSNHAQTRIAMRDHPLSLAWGKTSAKPARGFARRDHERCSQSQIGNHFCRRSGRRRSSGRTGQKRISRQAPQIFKQQLRFDCEIMCAMTIIMMIMMRIMAITVAIILMIVMRIMAILMAMAWP